MRRSVPSPRRRARRSPSRRRPVASAASSCSCSPERTCTASVSPLPPTTRGSAPTARPLCTTATGWSTGCMPPHPTASTPSSTSTGEEYVQLAADLGIPRDRIETIIAFAKAEELSTKADGSATASNTDVLAEIATLVAGGEVEIPIAARYGLDQVQDAFAELEQRHTRGKIVLIP